MERPGLDRAEAELPPPPEDQGEEQGAHPHEVHPVDSVLVRVLDQPGQAAQQVRDPEADDDRGQNGDVFEDVHGSSV